MEYLDGEVYIHLIPYKFAQKVKNWLLLHMSSK